MYTYPNIVMYVHTFNKKFLSIVYLIDPLEGNFFEGDIYGVKLTSLKGDSEGEGLDSKNAIKNTFQKWPSGEIPYVISNSFGSHDRSVIRAATDQFSRHRSFK